MDGKDCVCCFTGHRKLPANRINEIVLNLDRAVEALIAKGVTNFISGGALGFDQLAASLIIAKREMGANVRLIFALPCMDQDKLWSERQKEHFADLLGEADNIIYVSERYNAHCMSRRNRYMVEHSTHCICALLQEKSGTAETVRFARKRGLSIVNVAKCHERRI